MTGVLNSYNFIHKIKAEKEAQKKRIKKHTQKRTIVKKKKLLFVICYNKRP